MGWNPRSWGGRRRGRWSPPGCTGTGLHTAWCRARSFYFSALLVWTDAENEIQSRRIPLIRWKATRKPECSQHHFKSMKESIKHWHYGTGRSSQAQFAWCSSLRPMKSYTLHIFPELCLKIQPLSRSFLLAASQVSCTQCEIYTHLLTATLVP